MAERGTRDTIESFICVFPIALKRGNACLRFARARYT